MPIRSVAIAIALFIVLIGPAFSQGFSAYISPPRIEIKAEPGKSQRQVVEIQHVGLVSGGYRLYTNDWRLDADNAVTFSDALSDDSCRPWVAIERRELTLNPGQRYRYRFEVAPPADTAPRECRFALMVEGIAPAQTEGDLQVAVSGRIGVIVYVSVGDVRPALSLAGSQIKVVEGQPNVVLQIRNSGNAHGRLAGVVEVTDADGKQIEMTPADLPILPGETRSIALTAVPVEEGKSAPSLRAPLSIRGELDAGGQSLPLDLSLAQ